MYIERDSEFDQLYINLPAEIKRHRFTVEEYHKMAEVGLLSEDDRVELIDGEIVEMAPTGTRHLACVIALTHLLAEASGGRYFVSVQNPVALGERNEPQSDLSLLRYVTHHVTRRA